MFKCPKLIVLHLKKCPLFYLIQFLPNPKLKYYQRWMQTSYYMR